MSDLTLNQGKNMMLKKFIGGSMNIGMPFIIVALLGAIALFNSWEKVPLWGKVPAIVVICVFLIMGFYMLSEPTGLGERSLQRELEKEEQEKDD